MQIQRVFNNNVVLALDEQGRQCVLTGRGLGFQAKPGQEVDPAKVAKTFVAEDEEATARLAAYLVDLPPEVVRLATDILAEALPALQLRPSQALVLPLADHLHFAMKRAEGGLAMDYPLAAEVIHLYPAEMEAARSAMAMVQARTGIQLPDIEAVPIALHFVNASFATDQMARIYRMTEVFGQVFDVLDTAYGVRFDRASVSAARFVTHLRYLFVRASRGAQIVGEAETIGAAIAAAYPRAHAVAGTLALLVGTRLQTPVTADETAYIALHVARLVSDARAVGADPTPGA